MFTNLFLATGGAVLGLNAFRLSRAIYRSVYVDFDFVSHFGKDSWALITGGSAGVGLGYAKAFANRGINLVLVANSAEELAAAEKELGSDVKIKTIVADLSSSDVKDYEAVWKEASKQDISILVNNVGMGTGFGRFHMGHPANVVASSLYTTCIGHVYLTKLAWNHLEARKSKSAVINTSSIAGQYPFAYGGPYPWMKRFMMNMAYDIEGKNTEMFAFTPATMPTKLAGMLPVRTVHVRPVDENIEGMFDQFGKGDKVFIGGRRQWFMYDAIVANLPQPITDKLQQYLIDDMFIRSLKS